LLVGDLHLTDKPDDEYRWSLFPRLQAVSKAYQLIIIAGDLTQHKDNHSSALVNRMVSQLATLAEACPVDIVMGNHDYVDPHCPFFLFLRHITGLRFFNTPAAVRSPTGLPLFYLPHTNDWSETWERCKKQAATAELVVLHQTVAGTVNHFGQALGTIPTSDLSCCTGRIVSGDIHNRQKVGPVHYIGAPYPINFGDDFPTGRMTFKPDTKTLAWINFESIRKSTITIKGDAAEALAAADLREHDQIKVILSLPRSEFVTWTEKKQEVIRWCAAAGVRLYGVELQEQVRSQRIRLNATAAMHQASSADVVERFAESRNLDKEHTSAGIRLAELVK